LIQGAVQAELQNFDYRIERLVKLYGGKSDYENFRVLETAWHSGLKASGFLGHSYSAEESATVESLRKTSDRIARSIADKEGLAPIERLKAPLERCKACRNRQARSKIHADTLSIANQTLYKPYKGGYHGKINTHCSSPSIKQHSANTKNSPAVSCWLIFQQKLHCDYMR
jgi:hypothetical protein